MRHARSDYERFQDPAGLIPDDEPVFLVRGQDKAAPGTLRAWAGAAGAIGADSKIIALVLQHANAMEDWQRDHGSKVPDIG
jgi:hypothetical protein